MNQRACPDHSLLAEYAHGLAPETLRHEIALHIALCPRCREIANGLSDVTKAGGNSSSEEGEAFVLANSQVGCDVAEGSLADADAETVLQPCREDVESRFDFRLLEPPRDPNALGHL